MRPRTSISSISSRLCFRIPSDRRTLTSDFIFEAIPENDVVLLKQRGPKEARWRLSHPLQSSHDKSVKLHFGARIPHVNIIGRRVLDIVKDSTGLDVVLYAPSLPRSIVHAPRHAVPIYPADAQTIVNLMDINVERPDPEDDGQTCDEPFEVFEAGTGAGSLTVHIAKALHAGNPGLPKELRESIAGARLSLDALLSRSGAAKSLADAYLPRRRAILHTLDRNPKHTHTAHAMIHGFKRGMYLPNIDFHAGLIPEYLTQRLEERDGRPFLSRVVLDLPTASEYAELLIRCMHVNATLTLFTPSISQIASFESWSSTTGQPLVQDRVVELPTDSSDEHGVMGKEGGRPWKVKTVVPKRRDDGAPLVQIMRPLVGERVAGGGFVGVYRKMRRGQDKIIEHHWNI
ncbi:S-adenosyl-L-methionine-dependent methyltransferase [Emericellopsis atlantica]|uniref:tRNA (adenine(58)-N(1))-methyltransferase catalytic subunit TRM61 n=1 Tax=Emericellopsis atlantica TaxID=2614577 RepID=A0A9P8CM87_9HYPO|nr:S-adenosyl-L-methionine-dependent methyltransferase [Emericellopsis atlantica]KAG9250426.1 S-adenosyl-L-methionine-dependent methyltransferase [Emericellopsis atlantica]